MTHQNLTVLFLLFVSFLVVFASVTDTAHAQSTQSIVPTIILTSLPCNSNSSEQDCLVATTTSLIFNIRFFPAIDVDTFTGADITVINNDYTGNLIEDHARFTYHLNVVTERTITLKIPAGAVSDVNGNTNSAAELTIRVDHHKPEIIIPDEYLSAYGTYHQAVQIQQPYVKPNNITCVDKVYENGSIIRTDYYDAVPNRNVPTDFEPEDLPKIFGVEYSCTDGGHVARKTLDVRLVEDLSVYNTPPAFLKIERSSPLSETTDSHTLIYAVYFSKGVVGVDKNDFVLSSGSTGTGSNATHPATNVSLVSDRAYRVTISAATDGTYNLDLVSSGHGITDVARKPLANTSPTGADETYTVSTAVIDTTNPRLESIERFNPSSATTGSQTLVYRATFSEGVTGVTASDFILSTSGGNAGIGSVTSISGSSSVYYVTVTTAQDGTYNLDLVSSNHNIKDAANNFLSNTSPTGADETYTVDTTITDTTHPRLASVERYNPTSQNTDSQSLLYKATFSEGVTGVTASDFILSPGSTGRVTGTTQVTGISGSGDTYYVTVSSSTDGTYNLDLVSSGHNIKDAANNFLTNTSPTGADETYTVSTAVTDTTNPRLASVERYNPTSQNTDSQSLLYKVTFSEGVTGVTASDFILSPGSTGGGGTAITPSAEQFTHTRSPNLAIRDLQTVSDTMTVSNSGTATSISVAVDITHTYIGDLQIKLIAPDGTSRILRGHIGGGADDINKTYTPSFGSVPISGVWTLQIYDRANNDIGVLNSWTLTINYGTTTTTVSPVTGISGSGDTYYVTVSSSTDGTYNLDLVSSGHSIVDAANNPLTNTSPTGADETYTVSTAVTDTTNPRLASVERFNPTSQNTDSQSLLYKATFSEDVTGVTASDFILSPGSTGRVSGTTQVTGISGSGDTYYVTVSSTTDGTYNLDLVSSGHSIVDAANNPLTNTSPTGADETYTVSTAVTDTTNPRLASVERFNPTSQNTDSQSLLYKATFSEDVTGVTASDFILSPGSTGRVSGTTQVTGISGSGDTYYVTVSSTTDGTYNLDLVSSGHSIVDAANNPLTNTSPTGADETYTVSTAVTDTTNPRLASVERYNPTSQNTDSQSLLYKATFSEDVTGVTASDFILSPGSTGGGGTAITPSAEQFTHTRSPNLTIPNTQTVSDTMTVSNSGTATSISVAVDITHAYIGDLKINLIAPDGTSRTLHNYSGGSTVDIDQTYTPSFGSVPISGVWTLQIHDRTAPDPGVLNSWTLTINYGTTTTTVSPVTGISGSGDTYYVTVSSSTDGTYNLDLVSSGHSIVDAANNPLTNTSPTGADETYTVSTAVTDTTNPRLASVERFNPTSQNTDSQSLLYKATFSEGVTGVTASDFILSPGSTGGGGTAITPSAEQFTHTRSPNLAIRDLQTVSDTMTVSNSGTATSISVAVDITHTYIGDLQIKLIAPDGTSRILRGHIGGGADDINKTYTPSFGSVPISGVWTLQIYDRANNDIGVLNSWTLTINYGTTTTTVSPVTGISGSGDTYYVTVSSSTDGTYNLDLVSSGHSIVDAANNPLTNTSPTGADETYTVSTAVTDTTNPRLASVERFNPTSQNTDSQSLLYKATFSEDVTGVTASDFILSPGSTGRVSGTTQVTGISGSGDTYYVTVSSSTDGTYNLDLVSSGHSIVDAANNPLTNTSPTGADETYTVSTAVTDTTNPRLASVERYNPTSQNTDSQSLLYKATFSEGVTGVTASDFILSPGSTGRVSGTTQVSQAPATVLCYSLLVN